MIRYVMINSKARQTGGALSQGVQKTVKKIDNLEVLLGGQIYVGESYINLEVIGFYDDLVFEETFADYPYYGVKMFLEEFEFNQSLVPRGDGYNCLPNHIDFEKTNLNAERVLSHFKTKLHRLSTIDDETIETIENYYQTERKNFFEETIINVHAYLYFELANKVQIHYIPPRPMECIRSFLFEQIEYMYEMWKDVHEMFFIERLGGKLGDYKKSGIDLLEYKYFLSKPIIIHPFWDRYVDPNWQDNSLNTHDEYMIGFTNESDINRIQKWEENLKKYSGHELDFSIIFIFPELIQDNELKLNIKGWVEYE